MSHHSPTATRRRPVAVDHQAVAADAGGGGDAVGPLVAAIVVIRVPQPGVVLGERSRWGEGAMGSGLLGLDVDG